MTVESALAPGLRGQELTGQTAVIIGGSSGIGLSTAEAVRAAGGDVVLTGRDPGRLAEAAARTRRSARRRSTPPTMTRSWRSSRASRRPSTT